MTSCWARVSPHFQTAKVDDAVEFSCSSYNNVTWLFENGTLPPNGISIRLHRDSKSLLRITKVRPANAGTYTCVGVEQNELFEDNGELRVGKLEL